MHRNIIDSSVKRRCVEMFNSGKTSGEIYKEYFSQIYDGQALESFRVSLKRWRKKTFADDATLDAGTYQGFIAHGATVQVNGDGEIIQAWIKQNAEERQFEELINAIKENTTPEAVEMVKWNDSGGMLEIPLFDMHFPLSDHKQTLAELLGIIEKQHWQEINITIGQDMLHNDDFEGRTTKGTQIEKVDMVLAWELAKTFYYNVINFALVNANKVNVIYSKGNHDKSMAWAFVQMIREAFPSVNVDDSMKMRKCISWQGCFIGITHGNKKRSSKKDLRGQFSIQFPVEFGNASVREIHAGHLHHEDEGDAYGVKVRRLSTAAPEDEYSDDEGFVGSIKRFMVFEWLPGRLKAIYYIGGKQ